MNIEYVEGLVSVIIPTYNSEDFIERTIKSVLEQSYTDLEIIIVDDCSTDHTIKKVQQFAYEDKRIQVKRLKKNSGAAVARNSALEMAQGQFIAFIDSDDLWFKDKVKKQMKFMKDNNFSFTYTNYYRQFSEKQKQVSCPNKMSYDSLLKNTAIACSTVMIDRFKIGYFEMPLVRKGQDTATWLKLLKVVPEAYLCTEPLTIYTIREDSLSSNKYKALMRTWNIYYNVEKLSLLKSMYVFSFYFYNALKRRA